jgi:hypothetical protein
MRFTIKNTRTGITYLSLPERINDTTEKNTKRT